MSLIEAQWIEVRVAGKTALAEDIVGLTMEAVRGEKLPSFEAGAHVDLLLPNGMVRQYSLCGPPSRADRYELGILLEITGRGGSRSAHTDIDAGDIVRISEPRNRFALVPARHSILLAGGIGVTPMMAMAEHLCATDASFEMHYCARSPARAAFIDRLTKAHFRSRVSLHYDDGPASQKLDAKALLATPADGVHLYVCGPAGFMDFVTNMARAAGWPDAAVHTERFSPVTSPAGGARAFTVVVANTGRVVAVRADQTVVQALAEAGINVPVSCEQGICGTCVMKVLDGEPEHRDLYLSEEEHAAGNVFTPCCSRAKSDRLTIEL